MNPLSAMKSNRVRLLALLALLLLGAIIAVVAFYSEPRARGHTLTEWLRWNEDPDSDVSNKAGISEQEMRAAINEIGPRAIPYLLGMLRAEDTTWDRLLRDLHSRAPWLPIHVRWADYIRSQGVTGFAVLGTNARTAIPALTKLLYAPTPENQDPDCFPAYCLAFIGEESLPVFRAALGSTNWQTQYRVLSGLAGASNLAQVLLPEIRPFQTNSEEVIASLAVERLMRYAPREEAEQVAIRALQSGRGQVRQIALWQLRRKVINPEKPIPILIQLLNDRDRIFRQSVSNALRELDPVAAAAAGISTNPPAPTTAGKPGGRGRRPSSPPPP